MVDRRQRLACEGASDMRSHDHEIRGAGGERALEAAGFSPRSHSLHSTISSPFSAPFAARAATHFPPLWCRRRSPRRHIEPAKSLARCRGRPVPGGRSGSGRGAGAPPSRRPEQGQLPADRESGVVEGAGDVAVAHLATRNRSTNTVRRGRGIRSTRTTRRSS